MNASMHEVIKSNIEQSFIKHAGLWCLLLHPHLTIHHLAVGVPFINKNKLGWLTLGTRKLYHDLLYSERRYRNMWHSCKWYVVIYLPTYWPTYSSIYLSVCTLTLHLLTCLLQYWPVVKWSNSCRPPMLVNLNYSNSYDLSTMSLNGGGNTVNEL